MDKDDVVLYTTLKDTMAKFHFIQWLISFLEASDFFIFDWDSGNSMKSEEKHGVTIEQIESCFLDEKILT